MTITRNYQSLRAPIFNRGEAICPLKTTSKNVEKDCFIISLLAMTITRIKPSLRAPIL